MNNRAYLNDSTKRQSCNISKTFVHPAASTPNSFNHLPKAPVGVLKTNTSYTWRKPVNPYQLTNLQQSDVKNKKTDYSSQYNSSPSSNLNDKNVFTKVNSCSEMPSSSKSWVATPSVSSISNGFTNQSFALFPKVQSVSSIKKHNANVKSESHCEPQRIHVNSKPLDYQPHVNSATKWTKKNDYSNGGFQVTKSSAPECSTTKAHLQTTTNRFKILTNTKLIRVGIDTSHPENKSQDFEVITRNKLIRKNPTQSLKSTSKVMKSPTIFRSINKVYKYNSPAEKKLIRKHLSQHQFKFVKRNLSLPRTHSTEINKQVLQKGRSVYKTRSLRYINIGGKLFKSTGMSITRQKSETSIRQATSASTQAKPTNSLKNRLLRPGELTEIVRRRQKTLTTKKDELCLIYGMTGKCKRQAKKICPFVHNPKNVAICTRFLRGHCDTPKCLFSHSHDKNKMPCCVHFMEGVCGRTDCIYRHVNVNNDAPLCLSFLKGYCPRSEECLKKHVLTCQEYQTTGKCSYGNACPLSHKKISRKKPYLGKRKNPYKVYRKWGILGLEGPKLRRRHEPDLDARYFDPAETRGNKQECVSPDPEEEFELKRQRLLKRVNRSHKLLPGHSNIVEPLSDDDEPSYHISSVRAPLPDVLPEFIPL